MSEAVPKVEQAEANYVTDAGYEYSDVKQMLPSSTLKVLPNELGSHVTALRLSIFFINSRLLRMPSSALFL
jgi:hypothetical protein